MKFVELICSKVHVIMDFVQATWKEKIQAISFAISVEVETMEKWSISVVTAW